MRTRIKIPPASAGCVTRERGRARAGGPASNGRHERIPRGECRCVVTMKNDIERFSNDYYGADADDEVFLREQWT